VAVISRAIERRRPMPSPPADAEREIERVRAELALTLDALERKLAARHLVEKGFDMLRDNLNGNDALNRGLDVIRANPVPVALVGIGAAWLIAANTNLVDRLAPDERVAAARQKIAGLAGDIGARAGELAADITGRIGLGRASSDQPLGHTGNPILDEAGGRSDGWLHQMADMTQGALRSARDTGGAMLNRAGSVAGDSASRITDQLADTFERNPLMVGAIGIMAGALLAALVPRTRAEDRLLRDDELQRKAGEVGERAVAQMCETAARTLDAAAAAVRGVADKSHA